MSRQRPVFPSLGFGEVGLPTCSGPQMVAKSWLLLLQLSFGEWEEDRGRARMTWRKALGPWNFQQEGPSVSIPII